MVFLVTFKQYRQLRDNSTRHMKTTGGEARLDGLFGLLGAGQTVKREVEKYLIKK